MRRKIWVGTLAATAVAVVVTAAGVALTAPTDDPRPRHAAAADPTTAPEPAPTPAPRPPASRPAPAPAPEPAPEPAPAPVPAPAPPARPAKVTLPEGNYSVELVSVDVGRRVVTVDPFIYYQDGELSDLAYHRENPDTTEPWPYDGYSENEDTTVLRLPVGTGVPITVVEDGYQTVPRHEVDLAGLAKMRPGTMFWVTVEDGRVAALDEQFRS